MSDRIEVFEYSTDPVNSEFMIVSQQVRDMKSPNGVEFLVYASSYEYYYVDWSDITTPVVIHQKTFDFQISSIDISPLNHWNLLFGQYLNAMNGGYVLYDKTNDVILESKDEGFTTTTSVSFSFTGEYLAISSSGGETKVYIDGPDCNEDCKTCSGTTIFECTSCWSPKVLNDATIGSCILCMENEYLLTIVAPRACQPCDNSCATCSDGGIDDCTSCPEHNFLDRAVKGTCQPECETQN